MKEKLKKTPVLEKWFYTQSPLVITRPALRETGVCLTYMAGGFLAACGRIFDHPAPFGLGLLVSAGGGLRGLCTLLGAATGFLTMQPFSQGLEMTSSAILIFVTMYIFGSLWVTHRAWFRCLVPCIMSAAVGGIFLFSRELTLPILLGYLQNVFLAGLSPLAFEAFLRGKRNSLGALLAMCFFVIGGTPLVLPLGIRLGVAAAVALTASGSRRCDFGTAGTIGAALGAALDVSLQTSGLWALTLSVSALATSSVPKRYGLIRFLMFAVGFLATSMVTGTLTIPLLILLGVTLPISLLLPAGLITGREESAVAQSAALVEQRLYDGYLALKGIYDSIGLDPADRMEQERQHIFDRATAKVCRRCTRYHQCWEKNSTETYRALNSALSAILDRGTARREDFPEDFTEECRHMEGLLCALNQELEGIICRGQLRSRAEENRLIVSRVLLHISKILEENAHQLRCDQRIPEEAYTVRIGVSARGRRGVKVSGDRGVCFHTDAGSMYAILCDGAGTGEAAGKESLLAVDTLAQLIQSGMSPENAMEFINSMYILREGSLFSTIDVLELSLITGQGSLYKWGAAPSYVKSGTVVKKYGTAAPPPGLGVGNSYGAEVIRLSLWEGDMLVLVSDGVAGDTAENLIRAYEGTNVKELAAQLIAAAETTDGEDDMTVAVLRIEALPG